VHAAVQVDMERRLEEVKQQELAARRAQEEAASLLSAQQEKHNAEMAQLQEELVQVMASLQQREEQERANQAQAQSNFEDQIREMQVEYEKRTSERETDWSGTSLPALLLHVGALSSPPDAHRLCVWLVSAAKLDSLREEMDIERQQCLEEQARSHAATLQEKEALWTGTKPPPPTHLQPHFLLHTDSRGCCGACRLDRQGRDAAAGARARQAGRAGGLHRTARNRHPA
jgi:hypothetical protein